MRTLLLHLAVWTAIALIAASQTLLTYLATGGEVLVRPVILLSLALWYAWAALSPVIWWAARRLPLHGRGWPLRALAHLAINLVLAVIAAMVYRVLRLAIGLPPRGDYAVLIASGLNTALLVYWGVVAIANAVAYYRRTEERKRVAVELDRPHYRRRSPRLPSSHGANGAQWLPEARAGSRARLFGRRHMIRSTVTVAALLGAAASAAAQIPQRFENLQVLPKDITRDSLVAIMRGFSFGLGARCVYCHVGEDSPTLEGVDFDSDDRPAKRKAREMLRMVTDINETLAHLPERGSPPIAVRCATCHRGVSRPIPLEDSIYKVVLARDGAGGVAVYDSLRAEYHGEAAFDFGSRTLVRAAERLYADGLYEEAVVVLQRNVEAHPRFWNTYYLLGRSYEALNRRNEAIAAYRTTLERLPNYEPALNRLRALGAGGS